MSEETVNWFDAMMTGLAADGVLHPKGHVFVNQATGARTWVHPLELLDPKANGLVAIKPKPRPPTAVDEGEPPPPRPKKRQAQAPAPPAPPAPRPATPAGLKDYGLDAESDPF